MISQYRPRLQSVSPDLLSMVMLTNVTAFRSTSSGHHSPSLELSLGRSSPSLEMSYCGAIIGRRWYPSSFWHTEQTGKFTERQLFHIGFRLRCASCIRIHLLQSVELFLLLIPTIEEWILFVLVISVARVSETSHKTFSVLENQESGGNGGIISVVSCVDSSTSTRTPWSDNTSKDPKSMVSNGTFCDVSVSSSSQFPTPFPLGADCGSPVGVSFGAAICSNETKASTAETFSVNFTLPSSFAFAWIWTRFSANLVGDTVLHRHFPQIRHHWHNVGCCLRHSNFQS